MINVRKKMRDYIELDFLLPSRIKLGKKYYIINTQSMYQGMHFHVRRKIMKMLKKEIMYQMYQNYDYHYNNSEIKYPLNITYKFYHNKKVLDIDNISYVYIKAIHDCLKEANFIKDDNSNYISKYSVELIKNNNLDKNMIRIELKF